MTGCEWRLPSEIDEGTIKLDYFAQPRTLAEQVADILVDARMRAVEGKGEVSDGE